MLESSKNTKSRGKIRTLKIIEEEREKTQFFSELAVKIQQHFPQEHIDFLLYFGGSHKNSKSKWLIGDTSNHLKTPAKIPTERSIVDHGGPSPPTSKVDVNVFNTLCMGKEGCLRYSKEHCHDRINTTANKQQQKRFTKQALPRHLFEVDKNMKKNYQRVKQRMKCNSPQSTYRMSEENDSWDLFRRGIKTQRKTRYRTECQDENQRPGDGVPAMLLGEIAQRRTFVGGKMESLDKDPRWECFGGRSGRWRRRYKYGQ